MTESAQPQSDQQQKHDEHGAFYVKNDPKKILAYYETLRTFLDEPELIVKFHQTINNIECLIADDLVGGLPGVILPEQPEKRAFEFLCHLADLLGLESHLLRKHLYLKHVMRSQLGVHCILGLRIRNLEQNRTVQQRFIELEENGFAVHLDHDNRIVMLTATYQCQSESAFVETKEQWPSVVAAALAAVTKTFADEQDKSVEAVMLKLNHQGWVWVPDWKNHRYVLHYKIKLTTAGQDYLLLICPQKGAYAQDYERYPLNVHDQPAPLKIARLLNEAHPDAPLQLVDEQRLLQLVDEQRLPGPTRQVLMQGIKQNSGALEGPYTLVIDTLTTMWPTYSEPPLDDESSHLDRLMAYYHIDKIQRYFRALGLDLLNDYPALNPLAVVLSAETATSHQPHSGQIVLGLIEAPAKRPYWWTDARNYRTIYHEYVHAVTDAIARLQRPPKNHDYHLRYAEMLQAAAMDEGLADYFSATLAAQSGDMNAVYRVLQFAEDGTLRWKNAEDGALSTRDYRTLESGPMNLAIANQAAPLDKDVIYDWCQHWARYLWLLRAYLGAEVADMLIANSILFLTRWSSFSLGVLALVTTDRLLFNGKNRQIILATARQNLVDVAQIYRPNSSNALQQPLATPQQAGGMQLLQVDTEQKAAALATPAAELFFDPASLSFTGFTSMDEPGAPDAPSPAAPFDLGQRWRYDGQTRQARPENL